MRVLPAAARGLLALLALLALPAAPSRAQLRPACEGTLLEARGQAEQKRSTKRLRFSLALEAEAASADGALAELQRRLAAVRRKLQELQVQDLRVTSPNTWQRPAERQRPAAVQANLQLSGQLAPERLQPLIRQVGALPGVRLSPVATEADKAADRQVRQLLLRGAYQDALVQAREIAAAIGLSEVRPIEVQLEGGGGPVMMRTMAADAGVPPFDPDELPQPVDRLSLQVRFCAR